MENDIGKQLSVITPFIPSTNLTMEGEWRKTLEEKVFNLSFPSPSPQPIRHRDLPPPVNPSARGLCTSLRDSHLIRSGIFF